MELIIKDGDFRCPNCGAPEVDKTVTWTQEGESYHPFLLRMFKVNNDSNCTRCGCWFDEQGFIVEAPTRDVVRWTPGTELQPARA